MDDSRLGSAGPKIFAAELHVVGRLIGGFQAMSMGVGEATDEATVLKYFKGAHERLVDNPPWLFIVHDLNPRAFSKNVQGFTSAQSWFVDLAAVSVK